MLALLASAHVASSAVDTGFELLFENSDVDVPRTCWPALTLPQWLEGSYIMPSVGTTRFGGRDFQGVLDGFGKLHRFEYDGESKQMCETAKMMRTGFYNASMELERIAPSMLFMDTVPPRPSCGGAMCNLLKGANDNTFVNSVKIGQHYTTWTDSTIANEIDPISLQVKGLYKWTDKVGHGPLHKGVLGSAHPLRKDGNGPWVSIQIDCPLMTPDKLGSYVDIVLIDDADPTNRKLLNSKKIEHTTPYFHSIGVSSDHVILGYTPMEYDMAATMAGKPMIEAFHQTSPLRTTFDVVPFDGGASLTFVAPQPFTYNHVINCYENTTGIIFDAITFQDASLWLVEGGALLGVQRNKTKRDSIKRRQQAYRYHLHLAGDKKGNVTSEPLSNPRRLTEFPKINMDYSTKPYCIYYAMEQFHNEVENGAVAVVKHNICTGETIYWYRPNWFPSEPFFVPNPAKGAEDDGVVTFTALSGVDQQSYIVVVDAKDMGKEGVLGGGFLEQALPEIVGFTTHGQWYAGMIGEHA